MKITHLQGCPADVAGRVSLTVELEAIGDLSTVVSSVLAMFAGSHHVTSTPAVETDARAVLSAELEKTGAFDLVAKNTAASVAINQLEQVAPPAAATRTRRARTAPDAPTTAASLAAFVAADTATAINHTPATVVEVVTLEPTPASRRRTPVTAAAAPEVKVITDADLARACSNAAAVIGPEVVKTVVADFHVKAVSELAADVRERFLKELDDEVNAAKEEMAKIAAAGA